MQRVHYSGFRFEKHWLQFDDFSDVVQTAWDKPVRSRDAVRVLHIKLSRTAKALKKWGKQKCSWARFVSAVASDVIFNLDLSQESRDLTDEERSFRAALKNKLLGIAAIDRIRWRQRSRLTWLREGDANTRLFHLRANGRSVSDATEEGAPLAVAEREKRARRESQRYPASTWAR